MKQSTKRRTGQTLRMVQALYGSGIIVVHDWGFQGYVADMLRDVRGADFAKQWKIVKVQNRSDITQLMGGRTPIVVDHWVWEHIDEATARELRMVVGSTNAMAT